MRWGCSERGNEQTERKKDRMMLTNPAEDFTAVALCVLRGKIDGKRGGESLRSALLILQWCVREVIARSWRRGER